MSLLQKSYKVVIPEVAIGNPFFQLSENEWIHDRIFRDDTLFARVSYESFLKTDDEMAIFRHP